MRNGPDDHWIYGMDEKVGKKVWRSIRAAYMTTRGFPTKQLIMQSKGIADNFEVLAAIAERKRKYGE